ncbi:molybdenum cofactor biosynthesis protein [Photobacterium damselae]
MDVKKSWGFASIAIGMLSLIWGCISLSGMVGQEQVFADMSHFVQFSDSQLISKSMEQSLAAARHKNFIVLFNRFSHVLSWRNDGKRPIPTILIIKL